MAISFLQAPGYGSATNAISVYKDFGSSITSGSAIIVNTYCNTLRSITSVTDNASNSYSQQERYQPGSGPLDIAQWASFNVTPYSGTHRVTITADASCTYIGLFPMEFSGLKSSAAKDTSSNQGTNSARTSHPCAASGAIDTANDVLCVAWGFLGADGGTLTKNANFTRPANDTSTQAMVQYRIASGFLTDEQATWTSSSTTTDCGLIVSYFQPVTRFYFEYGSTAPVTPSAWDSSWNYQSSGAITSKLNILADLENTTLTNVTHTNDATATARLGATGRFVSKPIAAQTISGVVIGQVQCSESNANNDATLAIAVIRVNSSGTYQDTLLTASASDNVATAPPEFTTTLTNRRMQDSAESFSLTLTSRTFSDGDYLVVEIGVREVRATGTESLRFGTNASSGDLPIDTSTTTTTYRGWVQFSGELTFYTPAGRIFKLAGEGGGLAGLSKGLVG